MLSLAVKNISRNKRRSLLTALASLISIIVVILVFAYHISMVDNLIEINVLHMTGNIRVRKASYTRYEDAQPLNFHIEDYGSLSEEISTIEEVEHVEALSHVYVSIYDNEDMNRASLIAVDTEDSYFLFGRGSRLLAGHYIEKEDEILVSPGFLQAFSKEIGDRLTLVTRTADGGTNGASFTIAGVLYANDAQIANETIYADIDRFSKMTHMEDGAIELLVILKDQDTKRGDYRAIIDNIKKCIENTGRDANMFEVESWHNTSIIYPFISMYYLMVIAVAILFFLMASTLIVNTTTMSIMERTKEVSTLAALGFEKSSIRNLFIKESVIITLAGTSIGIILSMIVVEITNKTGIDVSILGLESFEGWGYPKMLYPRIAWYWYVIFEVAMVSVTVIAAIFATRKIKGIEVAEALRGEK